MMRSLSKIALSLLFLAAPLSASAAPPNTWAIQHQPGAAAAATISKAAVTNVRHVATGVTVCVSGVAAQPTLVFNLRDGATGAGTILWSARLMATIGNGMCVTQTFDATGIVGTKGSAMTLESVAATAATNFATVSLVGYDEYLN